MPLYDLVIIGSWAVFILFWIVSSFGVKRDVYRGWWRGWWMRAGIAAIAIFTLSHVPAMRQMSHLDVYLFTLSSTGALAWLGAALNVLGIALAVWARVHLGRNWSPAPAIKEEHELVTSGPYALVRHPIYTGMLLAVFGSALVNPWWFLMLLIVSAMFVRRVFVEEKLMQGLFPAQYPAYKQRTWALIPYVW